MHRLFKIKNQINISFFKWTFYLSIASLVIHFFFSIKFYGYENTVNHFLTSPNFPQLDWSINYLGGLFVFPIISYFSHQLHFENAYSWFLISFFVIGSAFLFSLIGKSETKNIWVNLFLICLFSIFILEISLTKLVFVYSTLFFFSIDKNFAFKKVVLFLLLVFCICCRIEVLVFVSVFYIVISYFENNRIRNDLIFINLFLIAILFSLNYSISYFNPKSEAIVNTERYLSDRNILPLISDEELKRGGIEKRKLIGMQYYFRDDSNYNYKDYNSLRFFLKEKTLDLNKIKFYYSNSLEGLLNEISDNLNMFLFSELVLFFLIFSNNLILKRIIKIFIFFNVGILLFIMIFLFYSNIQFQILHGFLFLFSIIQCGNSEIQKYTMNRFSRYILFVVCVIGTSIVLLKNENKNLNKEKQFAALIKRNEKKNTVVLSNFQDVIYYPSTLFHTHENYQIKYFDAFFFSFFDFFHASQVKFWGKNAGCLESKLELCSDKKYIIIAETYFVEALTEYTKLNYKINIEWIKIDQLSNNSSLAAYTIKVKS